MKKIRIKGFTLIELLATVIILAIVLTIAIPQVLKVIDKTRKNAFAADAIIAGKEAINILNTNYVNGNGELPLEGEEIEINIKDLKNKDLNKYTGEVIVKRENGKLIPYVTMNNDKYYICNTINEDITASSVTLDGDCITPDVFKVNAPVLAPGDSMTPIKWDENGNVVKTDTKDPEWYDYSEDSKKWANVMTADGSMWVWIPRYAYKITDGYHTDTAGTIEVKFLKGTKDTTFDGEVTEPVAKINPGSNIKFVTHPAFKFGDDELTGIWVAKFESSNNEGKIASVPNVQSWRSLTVSQMFDHARSMETNEAYGWDSTGSGVDTHMLKDVEWGAAVYLSWSTYGKNSEIWNNNSINFFTGCSGDKVNASYSPNCENAYNTTIGGKASTTGNYYGIYDMSGGAYENTAGYLKDGSPFNESDGASLISANSKYKDQYDGSSSNRQDNYDLNNWYYGNAIYETSSQGAGNYSWTNDYSYFVYSTAPFSNRGGLYNDTTSAGVFGFRHIYGYAYSTYSFRSAVLVQTGL